MDNKIYKLEVFEYNSVKDCYILRLVREDKIVTCSVSKSSLTPLSKDILRYDLKNQDSIEADIMSTDNELIETKAKLEYAKRKNERLVSSFLEIIDILSKN